MSPLQKRLIPLFASSVFCGLIFWYPVATPFMVHLGFNTAQIAYVTMIAYAVALAAEVPSGILADRWSRKGVLLVGIAILGIGSFWLGRVHSFLGYSLIFGFESIYYALQSGMNEAIIYDTLMEENGSRIGYERWLGSFRVIHSAGLATGSLAGALIASHFGFRSAFSWSLASCSLAFIFMLSLREPRLHRDGQGLETVEHIKQLLRLVFRHKETAWLAGTSILIGMLTAYMMSLDQLWPIALGLALAWYGPLNAGLLASLGVGGALANRVNSRQIRLILVTGLLVVAALGLLIHNIYVVAASEFGLVIFSTILTIVLTGRIQDRLPANQRASVGSLVGSIATVFFIPTAFIFGKIAQHESVFKAAWILVAVALLGGTGFIISLRFRKQILEQ